MLHGREPLGIGDDLFGRDPYVVHRLRRLDLQRAQPLRNLGKRWARVDRGDCRAQPVECGTLELLVRGVERLAVRLGVGKELLLRGKPRVFVGILDRGGVDLVELVPQQVDLACA